MQHQSTTRAKPVVSMCFSLMLALGKNTGGADRPDAVDYRPAVTVTQPHSPDASLPTIH